MLFFPKTIWAVCRSLVRGLHSLSVLRSAEYYNVMIRWWIVRRAIKSDEYQSLVYNTARKQMIQTKPNLTRHSVDTAVLFSKQCYFSTSFSAHAHRQSVRRWRNFLVEFELSERRVLLIPQYYRGIWSLTTYVCPWVVLLLLLVLVIRHHRHHHHDVYAVVSSPDDDVRENIIHYDEEGLGLCHVSSLSPADFLHIHLQCYLM